MNKKSKCFLLVILCIAIITVTGCNSSSNNTIENTGDSSNIEESETVSAIVLDTSDMFSSRDKEVGYDENESTVITLQDNQSQSSTKDASIKDNVITISKEGTYIFRGTLTEGQIIVDSEKTSKIQIVLDNVNISSKTSAPIYIKQADKVFITLSEGSENTLKNLSEFQAIDENNIDAVIFSKDDLTLNGQGSLLLSTEYGHGVVSKDELVITSGNYEIICVGHGLVGKDSVRIANGDFTIQSQKDGIHSENAEDEYLGYIYIADGTFSITSATDGIDGACIVQVDSGEFLINTGGKSENASTDKNGEVNKEWGKWGQESTAESTESTTDTPSAKAVKSDGDILINGGTFQIDSSDDSIHSNGNVFINNGTFTLSSGDDGIHADVQTAVSGGNIKIEKSYEGIEGQSIDITGGEISLVSSDDGLNAAGGKDSSSVSGRPGQGEFTSSEDAYINISGGTIYIDADGDGVDSNGNLYVSGGETYVLGPENNGNGALDYNGTAEISGGIFVAAGAGGMAQNFSDSSIQGSMLVDVQTSQTGEITLKDSTGKELIHYASEKQFNSVLISTPDIKIGETYTVNMGSEVSTIKMDSMIYGSGSSQSRGMGGQKGMGGRGTSRPEGMDGTEKKEPPEGMELPEKTGRPEDIPSFGGEADDA